MKLFAVILVIASLSVAECIKILGIFPVQGKSHYILGSSLMLGLAERGNDVTMISPFKAKNLPKNGTFREIVLTADTDIEGPSFDLFSLEQMNFVIYQIIMSSIGNQMTEDFFNHSNVQNLLKSNEKFDVIVIEQFINDALKVLAYHYKVPLVVFSTFGSNAWVNPLVANPAPPSYVAEQAVRLDHKNFFHRVKNFIIYVFGELNRNLFFFPAQNKILKKYFPDAPDLDSHLYNASLVLINSHVSSNKAVPRVPSMIDIGGFHLNPPKKLPQDLQEYLDGAKEGVVYFSMGSNLQSCNMAPEKRDAILKAFSKLKLKVLWKFEKDVLPGQPSNVKLAKWLPQQDVLAHPNIKLFITHGGLLSIIESVYHGVPVLAIPVFGDQQLNADEAVWNGFGLSISYSELSEEKLSAAIKELLENPKYYNNMKERSRIMQDRQVQPLDNADYWIKYVVKYKGAPHLRVDGLDLNWYQYLSIDVAVFLLGCILLTFYLLYCALRFIFGKLCSRNVKKVKTN